MQIQAYHPIKKPLHTTAAAQRNAASFSDLLADATKKTADASYGTARLSNSARAWAEYSKWRMSRDPINIPNTDGWNDENLQYLRDRYPGALSAFERVEALQTMANMGCITPEQYQKAVGTYDSIVVEDAGAATCRSGPLEEDRLDPYTLLSALSSVDWETMIAATLVGKAHSLDDLFALLDRLEPENQ